MRKKILVITICITICLISIFFYQRSIDDPASEWTPLQVYEPSAVLSPQETLALLKHLNTKVAAREAKLESGIVAFSLTLSKPTSFSKNPVYEDRVEWHVTYRFSGQRRFYQIQERVKVKPGWFQRTKWKESKRYEFQVEGSKEKGRVNRGDGWQWTHRHPLELGNYNSPLHWKWDATLTRMIQTFGLLVDTQDVIVEGKPMHYFKFEDWHPDRIETTELWRSPEMDYRTTRVLKRTRFINEDLTGRTLISSTEPLTEAHFSSRIGQLHYTCQLAQFEPGVWYPQITTEVREIVDSENWQFLWGEKLTLQIHSVVFNIPISVKDLLLFPDR